MPHFIRKFVKTSMAFILITFASHAMAQSSTTGLVTGVVTDSSGSVVAGAQVTLTNTATSATEQQITNSLGSYRFSFVPPARYTVSVHAGGFSSPSRMVEVSVGVGVTADFTLVVAKGSTTVVINGATPNIDLQDADSSTGFVRQQIQLMPNAGQDITVLGETAPGATTDTSGGKGSYSFYGLGGTANMFQVNGMDDTQMYNNRNESGSTNLTLGVNEIETATVVTNAYSGQYGRLAGSQIEYVTRSGTNAWHGDLLYEWNGRALNANNFFNNRAGIPRSFDNANQGAASASGPIIRNRMFFFADYTDMRVVIPTSSAVNIPSPEFEAATLANLQNVSPQSILFYQQIFDIYNKAAGASTAKNVLSNGGCGSFTALGAGVPCALQFVATPSNLSDESQVSWRIDQNISSSDHAFLRILTDHGTQDATTDPFNPALNVYSNQPLWEGQASETHTIGSIAANQFHAAFIYYKGRNQPTSIASALALSPFEVSFTGNAFTHVGYNQLNYNGRGETFYQLGDDFSLVVNRHTLRTGLVFRRDLMSYVLAKNTAGTAQSTLNGFYNGNADVSFTQSFPTVAKAPSAFYNFGWYGEDDWQVTKDLHFSPAIRLEHNSNPVCEINCFSRLSVPFDSLIHSADIPYNQAINASARNTFYSSSVLSVLPRIGFTWAPFGSQNTVVRGGFGLFLQGFPGQIIPNFETNTPLDNSFSVTGAISPAVSGSASSQAAASAAALASGFSQGETLAQLKEAVPVFSAPTYFNADGYISAAIYREWNLEVQHAFGENTRMSVNYVGNNGSGELFENKSLNGYCPTSVCPNGYTGLPATVPDSRFKTLTVLTSAGYSNYNGLTVSFRRNMSHNFLITASYTFGHALDVVSNGGILGFTGGTDASILTAQQPLNPQANYGNADYDVRHAFNLNYLWQTTSPFQNHLSRALLGGWAFSGTAVAHSGYPFTVTDSGELSKLKKYNVGGTIFANYLGGRQPSCSVDQSCLNTSDFSAPTSGFGQQERNQFRGPGFFNTDFRALKKIPAHFIKNSEASFAIGAEFSNFFNHANFDPPISDLSNAQFGKIIATAVMPTSVLGGSNLGADASPRMIQLTAKFSF